MKLREELQHLRDQIGGAGDPTPSPDDDPSKFELPLPAAYAINIVEAEVRPHDKSDNLLKGMAVLLRYLGAAALAEYTAAGCFDRKINKLLLKTFRKKVSDGSWLQISREIARAYNKKSPTFLTELPHLWTTKGGKSTSLHDHLSKLVELRNVKIKKGGRVDEASVKAWLDDAIPNWNEALKLSTPLFRYKLVFIEGIEDIGDDESALRYLVRWLAGEAYTPRCDVVEWRHRLKKNRLYLVHPGDSRLLPLSPFLEYEHCEITRARETCCLEQVFENKITLSTFRIPYRFQRQGPLPQFAI